MIALEGVTIVAQSGIRILDAVDLRIGAAEVYALVAERPTPLSMVIDALLGFSKPQTGSISVLGYSAGAQAMDVRRVMTAIRAPSGFEPHLTVRANIELLMRLAGHAAPRTDAIDAALRESDIPDRRFDAAAGTLMPFEQRAVWLAVARLRGTTVLLCDDPTVGLNESEAARLGLVIRDLAAAGPAALVATHDAEFARAVADRGGILDNGRLVLEWARNELPVPAPGWFHG